MSKDDWIKAHEEAIEEALEKNPTLDWSTAYESEQIIKRADEIHRDRMAARIDYLKELKKYGP